MHSPGADLEAARSAWQQLAEASGGMWRLSIRRTPPHLEVHAQLPATRPAGAHGLLDAFAGLGRTVMA